LTGAFVSILIGVIILLGIVFEITISFSIALEIFFGIVFLADGFKVFKHPKNDKIGSLIFGSILIMDAFNLFSENLSFWQIILLMIASYLSKAQMNTLQKKTAIPVVSINNGSPGSMTEKEFKQALIFLAEILNQEERAEELINYFNQSKLELKSRTAAAEISMTVYIGGIGNKGAQGITSTESNYPPFTYLDLKNIIEEKNKSNFTISKEQFLLENPDLIFIDQGGIELVKNDLKREEFKYLKSYQNNNIYQLLPYNHYTTNFATMLADAYYIAKIIYPEEFKNLKVEKKADQIYKKFVGEAVYTEMAEIFGGFKKMNLQ